MEGTQIAVLLTGDVRHRDFHAAVDWLASHTQLVRQTDLEETARQLQNIRPAPRLIVVAQSRPGQFSARQIESLHRAAPLARLICLLGSWCEGETRSGRPWPGVERIYWHELPAKMAAIVEGECGGGTSPRLPRTATVTERLLAIRSKPELLPRRLAGIHSPTRADYLALADTCRCWGFSAVWVRPQLPLPVGDIELLLWDGASGEAAEAEQLRGLASSLAPVAVAALLTFPRVEDVERMRRAGAGTVLTKPFMNEELRLEIERLLPMRPIAAPPDAAVA
jgi:hypothetical protein